MAVSVKQKIRFGPFELDVHSAELYKNDYKLKVQPQPIQVLSILLEHPGELVTRDELQRRIWPSDTFVDFEHGLNTAVKKLRQALGDESDTPKYIETLPRRGYRFLTDKFVGPLDTQPDISLPDELPLVPNRKLKITIAALISFFLLATFVTLSYSRMVPKTPRIVQSLKLTNTRRQKVPELYCYLATDGSRVYFQEHRSHDQWFLSQVSTSGGETSDISIPAWRTLPCLLGVSPSGSELLISDCCPVKSQRIPLPAGPGRPAAIPEWSHHATWMPDGKGFVYVALSDQAKTLMRGSDDGRSQKALFTSQDMLIWPRISPDGRRVRWTVWKGREGGPSDIWEADIDGSNAHPVFPEMKGATLMGDWTADGELYFFYYRSHRPGTTGIVQGEYPLELWAVREKLSPIALRRSPTLLYAGPLELRSAVASRNSKEIYAIGADQQGELSVFDADKSKFVPFLNGIQASFVTFSPDQQWIAYVSYPDGALWRSRVDGSDRMQLTFPPMGVVHPRWSPDGKLIAFEDLFSREHHSIYLVSPSGGVPRLLVAGDFDPADPTWSPDNMSIAYGGWGLDHIEVLNIQNMQSTALPGSERLSGPSWSPDGKYIIAHKFFERELVVFSLAEKKWRVLASNIDVSSEAWSHDSKYVYAHLTKEGRIVRIGIDDGRVETVTDLSGVSWTGTFYRNGWFGLTPDDRVMILRDTGSEDIYKFKLDY